MILKIFQILYAEVGISGIKEGWLILGVTSMQQGQHALDGACSVPGP